MSFNVKARVLLELGAELISSDGIALYELIKNAVDAGSESIEIRVQNALTPSGYKVFSTSLSMLASNVRLRGDYLQNAAKRYFDASASQELRNKFIGMLEGKSPVEAKALVRDFYLSETYIEVEDWGCGMSLSDLESKFLTIGTPNRANERSSAVSSKRILGEKGIGRLSAMRLGLHMEVITGTAESSHWAFLEVDWSKLRENLNLDLSDFSVSPEVGKKKASPDAQGTLIRISNLQSDWSILRLRELAKSELSKIQDPFDKEAEVLDLSITYNGQSVTAVEEIDSEWLQKWHGWFKVCLVQERVNPDDKSDHTTHPVLKGTARFRVADPDGADDSDLEIVDEKEIFASDDDLYSLLASAESGSQFDDPSRYAGIDTLGPFEAEGFWYNRQRAKSEFKDEYDSFKTWLEQWAGGLLMYRDGYRVYPYAAPDDDWLELDQRALRRKSFKLNRGQFVGYVRVTSHGNPELRDQTNRQGLCDSPEKRALIQSLQHVIWKELGALVTKYEEKATSRSLSTVKEIEKQVTERAKDAKAKLRELAKRVPEERDTVAELRGYVEELESAWSAAKIAIKKQAGQAELYMHLAGVGMLLEFVIHELNRVTHSTLQDLQAIKPGTLPPGLRSLTRQLQTLDKRLRILDPVSTPGRQRKEEADIVEVIQTLLDAHEQQFERHQVKAVLQVEPEGSDLTSNVVVGQMYQIFENLISNSVYWLSHHRALQAGREGNDGFESLIEVFVDRSNRKVIFRDNGSGIDWVDREKIFEPFFSKKPSGRGIGLYIVRNLCRENGIVLSLLDRDAEGRIPGFEFLIP
jgi:signal transduction histidine kinase